MSQLNPRLEACLLAVWGRVPDLADPVWTYGQVPEWDSLNHLRLVAEVEAVFEITLEQDEILQLRSLPVLLEILAKYGVK